MSKIKEIIHLTETITIDDSDRCASLRLFLSDKEIVSDIDIMRNNYQQLKYFTDSEILNTISLLRPDLFEVESTEVPDG